MTRHVNGRRLPATNGLNVVEPLLCLVEGMYLSHVSLERVGAGKYQQKKTSTNRVEVLPTAVSGHPQRAQAEQWHSQSRPISEQCQPVRRRMGIEQTKPRQLTSNDPTNVAVKLKSPVSSKTCNILPFPLVEVLEHGFMRTQAMHRPVRPCQWLLLVCKRHD